jgi:MoaA/NifB/PqqE/SkfB family radical SAM enzyme
MNNAPTTETVKDCHYPWTWMMVTADGGVKPCCFAPGTLGNVVSSTPDEVWNGPVAIELRSFIRDNRVHPVCAGAPCKFVQNMQAR